MDDVVALLSWTGRNKPVVYIGWAAVSGGQLGDPLHLPSPLADSKSGAYGFPDVPELPHPLPQGFTRLGLMTVMFELMEPATCRYKKIKSRYIYLHVNPIETANNTSPHPFWTKRGFGPVNETLVIAPLTATEDKIPLLIHRHTFKTTAQAEVPVGLKELREHLILHPNDGKSSHTNAGLVIYSRAHQNDCPAVHTLTDAARESTLSEAARAAQEAQVIDDTQPEEDETKRKANEKLALDAVAAAAKANETQAAENKQREDAETKRKAANKSPVAAQKRKAKRAAAEKKYTKATAVAKKAQNVLAKHRSHGPRPGRMSCRRSSGSRQRKGCRRKPKKSTRHRSCSWPI
jgi:hypothetical protein